MGKWWNIAPSKNGITRVDLYNGIGEDQIDGEKSLGQFLNAFNSINGAIDLHINSDGGFTDAGSAIYNAIKSAKGPVIGFIDSMAASIASVIATACSRLVIAPDAFVMIHDPVIMRGGASEDLRKSADYLDKIKDNFVQLYAQKCHRSEDAIRNAMKQETWFTASEAHDFGLVDEIGQAQAIDRDICAGLALAIARYERAPQALRRAAAQWKTPKAKDYKMDMLDCYMRDGKCYAKVGDTEYEIKIPSEARTPEEKAEDRKPAPATASAEDLARAVASARAAAIEDGKRLGEEAARSYDKEFSAIAGAAGIDGAGLVEFRKFYGIPLDQVKFLAQNSIAARAKAQGEGNPANSEGNTDPAEAEADRQAAARFAGSAFLRSRFQVPQNASKGDPAFDRACASYVASLRNTRAQSKNASASSDKDAVPANDMVSRLYNRFASAK